MDSSGLIQSYNPRAASSAALTRTILAPQYFPQSFGGASPSNMATNRQIPQHNPFGFGVYSGGNSGLVAPYGRSTAEMNYIRQRPDLVQSNISRTQRIPFVQNSPRGYIEKHHSQSPRIKTESLWNMPSPLSASPVTAIVSTIATTRTITPSTPVDGVPEVKFGTGVDVLMKAIQSKETTTSPQTLSHEKKWPVVGASPTPPPVTAPLQGRERLPTCETSELTDVKEEEDEEITRSKGTKKRYRCTIKDCGKTFHQKTHLDIHKRSHTGERPYPCSKPGCGRYFSQLGNLKTHERRHTGERPYSCPSCHKRFAQRGNVRAHMIVHNPAKPYICRLDSCGKQFTQLGNLKSHQNKFHIPTIQALTSKFASMQHGDIVNAVDKELWLYFANLYKNSNKGIKGRGKDRKVGQTSTPSHHGLRDYSMNPNHYSGASRGNMVTGVISGCMAGAGRGDSQYEIFDADDESQSSSHSHSGSSTCYDDAQSGSGSSCYDDAPSDGFPDTGRNTQLAFGDRIY